MDLATSIRIVEHNSIKDDSEVKQLLKKREAVAETAQVGGSNTRLAIASVPRDLASPRPDNIHVDTFVLDGNTEYGDKGLRKDLSLMQGITGLVIENAHQLARNLKMIFGFSGAPTTNTEFIERCEASSDAYMQEPGTFYLPNVRVVDVEGKSANLLNLPDFINKSCAGELKSSFKFENQYGVENQKWYPEKEKLSDEQSSVAVKVVNDAVAHLRYQAANYEHGASLMHLVMSTGTNVGIGYKKQDDELGNFEQSINTEAGHIPFADLLPKEAKSPLVLRGQRLENPSFEAIMAGGNSASPERGLAGLVRDLRVYANDKDGLLVREFIDRANNGRYADAMNLATGKTMITDDVFQSSSLIQDDIQGDMNQAIEEAAIQGDPLAKVLIAIWSRDLADVLNGLAAKAKSNSKVEAGTKFNLSVNGSLAYGILDNANLELDFAKTILAGDLNEEDFITGLLHPIAISRPLAEMDGLAEQAYKFAVAAVQAA
jgi:hypothetical protein